MGIVPYKKETSENSLTPFNHVRIEQKDGHLSIRKQTLMRHEMLFFSFWILPASKTLR